MVRRAGSSHISSSACSQRPSPQARFQKLCDATCYCGKAGCSPGTHCTCEVCQRTEQFDSVVYPNQTATGKIPST